MIRSLEKSFQDNDRDVDALAYLLVALVFVLVVRAGLLISAGNFEQAWSLLPLGIPLLSALLVVRVANRLIINGHIVREDDRRQELVRTTHHMMAIASDLRQRVGYFKSVATEGGRPILALIQIAKTIEARYETLLARDGYSFLPGPCVDIIIKISGHIFGIGAVAEALERGTESPQALTKVLPPKLANESIRPALDALMADLKTLIDELHKVRLSVDEDRKPS